MAPLLWFTIFFGERTSSWFNIFCTHLFRDSIYFTHIFRDSIFYSFLGIQTFFTLRQKIFSLLDNKNISDDLSDKKFELAQNFIFGFLTNLKFLFECLFLFECFQKKEGYSTSPTFLYAPHFTHTIICRHIRSILTFVLHILLYRLLLFPVCVFVYSTTSSLLVLHHI